MAYDKLHLARGVRQAAGVVFGFGQGGHQGTVAAYPPAQLLDGGHGAQAGAVEHGEFGLAVLADAEGGYLVFGCHRCLNFRFYVCKYTENQRAVQAFGREISRNTVRKYVRAFQESGLSPEVLGMSDEHLYGMFVGGKSRQEIVLVRDKDKKTRA